MKTAFSLMLARHDDGTHRAAARAEVAGARRLRWGSNSSACGAVAESIKRDADDGGFHLRLNSRTRAVFDPVQPEHAVVLAAGQLLPGVLARGSADAIKVHHGVTGTRDHIHAAAIALDEAAQA